MTAGFLSQKQQLPGHTRYCPALPMNPSEPSFRKPLYDSPGMAHRRRAETLNHFSPLRRLELKSAFWDFRYSRTHRGANNNQILRIIRRLIALAPFSCFCHTTEPLCAGKTGTAVSAIRSCSCWYVRLSSSRSLKFRRSAPHREGKLPFHGIHAADGTVFVAPSSIDPADARILTLLFGPTVIHA